MSYRVGVDIGGTFIDFCVFDEDSGAIATLKVLTTPSRPGAEIIEGLATLHAAHGIDPSNITAFVHGTTVGVNTVIQRRGARLALFTTENFCDVLEVARLRMPESYSLFSTRPEPLITRERVFGIAERITADGSVRQALDEVSVHRALHLARAQDVDGIIVALLHGWRNPAHELAVKSMLAREAPDLFVFTSSEIWPVIREYERTTTAVINGYIHPRVNAYLTSLQSALKEMGVPAEPLVTKSNGGMMRAERGKNDCVQMVLSGTAAGVMGGAQVARDCGAPNAITLDIGGTSADVATVIEGAPQFGMGEKIGEFPLYVPSVSVTSIGDGGGSIAWADEFGVLKVGPESAGSDPGPACYGRGGTRPTITDAFAVCGLLGHRALAYDSVPIDRDQAEAAVGELAARLGRGVEETAEAIIKIAISGMYLEINKLIAQHGIDIRDFALVTFGGAGPMLGGFLARELGMARVVVPVSPGVTSALGGLIADTKNDFIKTLFLAADRTAATPLRDGFMALRDEASAWLRAEGCDTAEAVIACSADMRYAGQSFEIEVPFAAECTERGDIDAILDAFHDRHDAVYAFCDRDAEAQILNLRLVASHPTPKPVFAPLPRGKGAAPIAEQIDVYLDGQRRRVPLYERSALCAGHHLEGPAVVAQADATVCLPGGFSGTVDSRGNILLLRNGAAEEA